MQVTDGHPQGEGERAGDERPSDRAGPLPRSVALLSVHTSPLAQAGTGDGGGMNVFISALATRLRAHGLDVRIFTRNSGADLPPTVTLDDGVRVHHIDAGPPTLRKEDLASHLCAFYLALAAHPGLREAQILHGHYWMGGWVGRKLRRHRALPLVQHSHALAADKDVGMGDAVVVQGLGLLGLYGCAIARARGARRVIALDTDARRLARGARFGADETLDAGRMEEPALVDAWWRNTCVMVGGWLVVSIT